MQFSAKECSPLHILSVRKFAEVFRLIRAKYESIVILFKPPNTTVLCSKRTKCSSFPVNVASDGARLRADENIAIMQIAVRKAEVVCMYNWGINCEWFGIAVHIFREWESHDQIWRKGCR